MKALRHPSVRIRITLAAALVFAVAFGAACFGLITRVRTALEDDVRQQSAAMVGQVQSDLEAGMPFDEAIDGPLAGAGGVMVQVLGPDGRPVQPHLGDAQVGVADRSEAVAVPPPAGTGELVTSMTGMPAALASTTSAGPNGDVLVLYRQASTPAGPLTIVGTSSLANVQTTVATLGTVLLFGTPLLVVLVGLLVWVLVGRALRPVEAIRSEVDEISHSTIHRRIAEPGTRDEVHRLAVTMNEMLERLEMASNVQRQFVSDASHELKTPLATNRARLEVALAHPETADWLAVSADVLATEERLTRLVTDLLDIARFSEATADPTRVPTDLASVIRDVVDTNQWSEVALELPAQPVIVDGEPIELARLVQNILGNAVAHRRHRAAVALAPGVEGTIVVTIDDDGPGVPPDQRERVFQRFVRLDESRNRRSGGTGLGLPIAKAIVERHRGRISITSAPDPLGGARVEIHLPRPPEVAIRGRRTSPFDAK